MINSIVAGNWKMNKTPKEGKIFIEKMISDLDSLGDTNVIICPPFTYMQIHYFIQCTSLHVGFIL